MKAKNNLMTDGERVLESLPMLALGLFFSLVLIFLTACQSDKNDSSGTQKAQNTPVKQVQAADKKATGKKGKSTKKGEEKTEAEAKAKKSDELVYNVEAATVRRGLAQATYRTTAVLQADREAEVSSKASGVVESIKAEAGDTVKKGQVLAVLESAEQRLRLQQARANYEKTRNNWERSRKLLAKGLANAESVSNLKYETQVLKAVLDEAQLAYENTRIKSPIDGTLVTRFIKVGSLVKNGDKAFKVVDFDSLQAVVNVPEMQLQNIRAGLPAWLQIDALDNAKVAARVLRVSPAVDEKTGTFAVTLEITDAEVPLRPGLFSRVFIVYDQHPDALLVDKNAIIHEDGKNYVWKINGDGVKKIVVRTGYAMGDDVEILTGLQAGDKVVTTGKNNLSAEARVNVIHYD